MTENYIILEKLINKPFITKKEMEQFGFNEKKASKFANKILNDMKAENVPIISTRPMLLPTQRVLAILGIDPMWIREQAEQMKKSSKC